MCFGGCVYVCGYVSIWGFVLNQSYCVHVQLASHEIGGLYLPTNTPIENI